MLTYKEESLLKKEEKMRSILPVLPDYVQRYMSFIQLSTSASTRLGYTQDLLIFFDYFADKQDKEKKDITIQELEQLTADELTEFFNYLECYEKDGQIYKNSHVAIRRKLSSVRGLYNYLFSQQLIMTNPILRIKPPKVPKKEIIYMNQDESSDFLDTVMYGDRMTKKESEFHDKHGIRDFALLSLMLGTGIRVSEVVGLNVGDLDLNNHTIHVVRKGGKEDFVYFSDEVGEIMKDYMEIYRKTAVPVEGHEQALFLSTQRRRFTPRSIEYMVNKYLTPTELLN